MHSVPAEATQSWFVAKPAVALSPILVLLTADVIGRLVRRTLGGAPGGASVGT
jgi:hypothetical protein